MHCFGYRLFKGLHRDVFTGNYNCLSSSNVLPLKYSNLCFGDSDSDTVSEVVEE
jgi:hypothetical protein